MKSKIYQEKGEKLKIRALKKKEKKVHCLMNFERVHECFIIPCCLFSISPIILPHQPAISDCASAIHRHLNVNI